MTAGRECPILETVPNLNRLFLLGRGGEEWGMWRAFIEFQKRILLGAIGIGRRPDDDDAERVRKAVLAIFALFMATGLPLEVWLALERGQPESALLLGAWAALSMVCLVHFCSLLSLILPAV